MVSYHVHCGESNLLLLLFPIDMYVFLIKIKDNYDTARAVEIATVDMSTCDETSVESIVHRKKNTKRQRKKTKRLYESSSSNNDSDKDDDNNNNEEDEGTVSTIFFY